MPGRNRADPDIRDNPLDVDECEGHRHFRYRNQLGERVVGYSLYGELRYPERDDIRHAFVFRDAGANIHGGYPDAPEQRMSRMPLDALEFGEELEDMRADGWSAAYIGVFGSSSDPRFRDVYDSEPRYSAIYEPTPPGTQPEVIMGARWNWPVGPLRGSFLAQLNFAASQQGKQGMYARSVGVFGSPRPADFVRPGALEAWTNLTSEPTDEYGSRSGLHFVATLWPKPFPGFAWTVQLTPNHVNLPAWAVPDVHEVAAGPWIDRWETHALGVQAFPVAGIMTVATPGLGRLTLTLWHVPVHRVGSVMTIRDHTRMGIDPKIAA